MIPEEILRKAVEQRTINASIGEWRQTLREGAGPIYNYRLDHTVQVVELSKALGREVSADMEIVIMAAWLHDIAKPGLGGVSHHGVESAKIATEILRQYQIDEDIVHRVADVIEKHVGLTLDTRLDPIEAQVVWEADKLAKLGVTGFVHYIINGIQLQPGMNLKDMTSKITEFIPLARKIAASMHTALGKEIARQRLSTLELISARFKDEVMR